MSMVTNHFRYSTVLSNLRRRWVTSCVDISYFVLSFATSLAWSTICLRFTLLIPLSTPCSSSLTTLITHFFYCFNCFNRWAIYLSNKTLILGINSVELSIKKILSASFMKCISIIKKRPTLSIAAKPNPTQRFITILTMRENMGDRVKGPRSSSWPVLEIFQFCKSYCLRVSR